MDTCFLQSMLHFTSALKKDFIEMWINKMGGLIKYNFILLIVKLLIFCGKLIV